MPSSTSFRLHSAYNPILEAERFIEQKQTSVNPAYIIVTEPGESWLAKVLRERFPDTRLIAIRYTELEFYDSDCLWDFTWRPGLHDSVISFLHNLIPDEYIPLSLFWAWTPSDAIWKDAADAVWKDIKKFIELQVSVAYTRTVFGPIWLRNINDNVMHATRLIHTRLPDKPVLIAAAGPSLEHIVPVSSSLFYLLSVSSANTCLLNNKCIPDACMVTDGGYWVTQHFRAFPENIPIYLPLEAYLPKHILGANPISFLDYGSGIENAIFRALGFSGEKADRNGSVSGTAVLYALKRTNSTVFFSGLDLEKSNSFSHARPHPSSSVIESTINRLSTLSTFLYQGNMQNGPLEMYKDWFSRQSDEIKSRIIRIEPVSDNIPGIQSCSIDSAFEYAKSINASSKQSEPSYLEDFCTISERRFIIRRLFSEWEQEAIAYLSSIRGQKPIPLDPLVQEYLSMVAYQEYVELLKRQRDDFSSISICPLFDRLTKKVRNFNKRMNERSLYE